MVGPSYRAELTSLVWSASSRQLSLLAQRSYERRKPISN